MEAQPYVDPTHMAAAGASYGGYMMNWLNGHTDKFRCIVNHDGVYNFYSMYGATEEVWFDEVGARPAVGESRLRQVLAAPLRGQLQDADADHPQRTRFPRADPAEGQQLFTTLQAQGHPVEVPLVPRRGALGAQAREQRAWHQTVFSWLAEYLK